MSDCLTAPGPCVTSGGESNGTVSRLAAGGAFFQLRIVGLQATWRRGFSAEGRDRGTGPARPSTRSLLATICKALWQVDITYLDGCDPSASLWLAGAAASTGVCSCSRSAPMELTAGRSGVRLILVAALLLAGLPTSVSASAARLETPTPSQQAGALQLAC